MNTNALDVKKNILSTAKRLFALQGYEATTVRQICEASGVNAMMISYHFGGKENVLNAIFQTFLPIDRFPFVNNEISDPISDLAIIIREIISLNEHDPDMIILLQQEMLFASTRNESLQKWTMPIWERLREILEMGRQRRLFEYQSIDITLIFLISTILMFKHRDFLKHLSTDPLIIKNDELVKETCKFIFNALRINGEADDMSLIH